VSELSVMLGQVFVVLIMLAMGAQVRLSEMLSEARTQWLLARALLANLVLAPLLGVAVVHLFHLKGDVAAGLLLLALAPGAPFAANFTTKARGAVSFAVSLFFVLLAVSVVFTPIVASLVLPGHIRVSLPWGAVARSLVTFVLVPFAAGLALRNRAETVAASLARPAEMLALLFFVAAMVVSLSAGKQARSAIGADAVLAMLVFIVVAMLIGWLLGGPERGHRQALAVGTSMRNVAVALALVQSLGSDTARLVVVAFFSLMVPCNMLFTVYETIRQKGTHESPESR